MVLLAVHYVNSVEVSGQEDEVEIEVRKERQVMPRLRAPRSVAVLLPFSQ